MLITDVTFLLVFGIGILAFSIFSIIWKGILFFPILAAIFWILFGVWCRQAVDVNFMFMREIGVIFIGVGIAWFWAPWWLKAKDVSVEENAPDDIDVWGEQQQKFRERIDKHKSIRRRNREV